MEISNETKVKEIALSNPRARQILEDAGVDYCCGRSKSLHEACLHAEVAAEEILKRLRENKINATPDEKVWTSLDSWLESELRRFHRAISLALLLLATVMLLAEAVRHAEPRELALVGCLLVPLGIVETKLFSSFLMRQNDA